MKNIVRYPKNHFSNNLYDETFNHYYDIHEKKGICGGIIVYLTKKNNKEDITICGYRKTSILFGYRIQLIPEEKRKDIKSKLLHSIPKENEKRRKVKFWDYGWYEN